MNTSLKETRVLRCSEDNCGVSFMTIKGKETDTKIGLAQPRRVALNPSNGEELIGTCPRHKE